MKIAVDCRMIGSGGIGSYIYELIPNLLKENQCLLIGTHEQCMDFLRLENVEFCFCNVPPFSLKELFFFSSEVLKKINACDVYFSPYCNIPQGIQIPVFSTIHDVVFLDVKELTGKIGRIIRKFFYKRSIKLSQVVFTVSQFSKERIIKNLKCKKNIVVIYNAAPAYLLKQYDTPLPQKEQIIFVGNIKKHKGLKSLLDAFEIACKKGFTKKLVIVGNADNFRTGDSQTVKRLKDFSKDQIEFTGRIDNEQLKKLYTQSMLLVQPSLYEGFGMPPLEALTCGTPVLISDIPVFKEIYSEMPVQYFRANDSQDLAQKLLTADFSRIKNTDFSYRYNYNKSASIITKTMEQYTKY